MIMENYSNNDFVRPKKALGQHFLVDLNIARNIVNALSTDHDVVIEVGAGMGVLTQYLIENQLEKLQVVEIDKKMLSEGFFRPHQIVICVVSHSHFFNSSRKRR